MSNQAIIHKFDPNKTYTHKDIKNAVSAADPKATRNHETAKLCNFIKECYDEPNARLNVLRRSYTQAGAKSTELGNAVGKYIDLEKV